jgi:hypothetical protein
VPRAALLAFSSPEPGRTAEFLEWYEQVHVPEMRAVIPQITEVTRYRLASPGGTGGPPRFLTFYDLGDADVAEAEANLTKAATSGGLRPPVAMDLTDNPPQIQWYVRDSGEL